MAFFGIGGGLLRRKATTHRLITAAQIAAAKAASLKLTPEELQAIQDVASNRAFWPGLKTWHAHEIAKRRADVDVPAHQVISTTP